MKKENGSDWEEEDDSRYLLQLYVAGTLAISVRAIANLRSVLETHLKGKFDLEIIDVYQQPELAARENVTAVPLLIKKKPLPTRFLIGDMSDTARLMRGLGLQ